jgi:uncharacterized membrane protein
MENTKCPNSGDLHSDQTVKAVAQIERSVYDARSRVDHAARMTTRAAGSGTAIVLHVVWFLIWTLSNLGVIPGIEPFDPFPFSMLTTIVSFEVIFLTLFVLVNQNRTSREADKRAQLGLQVNLLAEKEVTMILKMLQEMSTKLGIAPAEDLKALLAETKLDELSEKLESALPTP